MWVFSLSRVRVRRYRHRAAAASSRGGGLLSGRVPEKMPRPVSPHAAVYVAIAAAADLSLPPPQEAGDDELQRDG